MTSKTKQQKAWSEKDARYDRLLADLAKHYDDYGALVLAHHESLKLLKREKQALAILRNKLLIEIDAMVMGDDTRRVIHEHIKELIKPRATLPLTT